MRNESSFFGSGFLFVKISDFLTIFRGEDGKNFLGDFGLNSGRVISLKKKTRNGEMVFMKHYAPNCKSEKGA